MTETAVNIEPTTAEATRKEGTPPLSEDRIRIRAYELFEKRSGAPGDAESDWYRAEAELKSGSTEPPK